MRNPSQKMRFTDEELSLIKGLFAGNDDLLYAVRKTMLQLPLHPAEQEALKTSMNDTTAVLIRKIFLPWLDGDSPVHQMTSLLLNLGSEIKSSNPDDAWPRIKAKELEMEYLTQQLAVLSGGKDQKIKLEDLADLSGTKTQREQKFIEVLAWNFLLSYIDSNIQQIKFLAGLKEESVEETKNRLSKDSTQ